MQNITIKQTKKLLKEFKIYRDGGTHSWIQTMGIIGTFGDKQNNIKNIQCAINNELSSIQKQIISDLID